ncbi:MAG: carboxypeptidase-like regulatory domain-containing protein [Sphingobacteriales bacterium]|nr:carboxypeptidase-like regulatory domain-containing protein [Sphingobacteriales bacterium]
MTALWAQTRQITGLVTDGKEPVIGSSVQVKGSSNGTATDVKGFWR